MAGVRVPRPGNIAAQPIDDKQRTAHPVPTGAAAA
jgi:hypothetical protein